MTPTTPAERWLPVEVRHDRESAQVVVWAASTPADLLPDLARAVCCGDLAAGVRIGLLGGEGLLWDRALQDQGVVRGSVLVLTSEPAPEPIQDDVIEAVAGLTAATAPSPDQARHVLLATAAALVLLGAGSLLPAGVDLRHALIALSTAGALAATAWGIVRAPHPWATPVLPAALALTLATVGLMVAPGLPEGALPRTWAVAMMLGVSGVWLLAVPPVRSVGSAALGLGLAVGGWATAMALAADPARSLLVVAVVGTLATDAAPRLALTRREESDPTPGWHRRWLAPAAEDLSAVREVWAGLAAARCLLLWAAAWTAPGTVGMVTAGVAALAVTLLALPVAVPGVRTSAMIGLVGSAALVFVRAEVHLAPWREPAALVLMVTAVLAITLAPTDASLMRERAAEVVGAVLLVALVPLTLLALGAARWWSG